MSLGGIFLQWFIFQAFNAGVGVLNHAKLIFRFAYTTGRVFVLLADVSMVLDNVNGRFHVSGRLQPIIGELLVLAAWIRRPCVFDSFEVVLDLDDVAPK